MYEEEGLRIARNVEQLRKEKRNNRDVVKCSGTISSEMRKFKKDKSLNCLVFVLSNTLENPYVNANFTIMIKATASIIPAGLVSHAEYSKGDVMEIYKMYEEEGLRIARNVEQLRKENGLVSHAE